MVHRPRWRQIVWILVAVLLIVALVSAVSSLSLIAATRQSLGKPQAVHGDGLQSWPMAGITPQRNAYVPDAARPASWHTHLSGGIHDQPTVVHGTLFVGSNGGYAYSLKASNGQVLWRRNLHNDVMTEPIYIPGAPDEVIFGVGDRNFPSGMNPLTATDVLRGTGVSEIAALSAKTGQVLWRFPTIGEDMPSPAYHAGVLYFANGDDHLYALSAKTGRLIWKLHIGSIDSMSSLALSGHTLYFGSDDPMRVVAVDILRRTVAWRTALPLVYSGVGDCSPAIAHGILVTDAIVSGGLPNHVAESVFGLSTRTGRVLWHHFEGNGYLPPAVMETAAPVIAGGTVLVGSPVTNHLYDLQLTTGRLLWKTKVHGEIRMASVVRDHLVLVADQYGLLYAIDDQNGRILGTRRLATSQPTSVPGIYQGGFGGGGGTLVGSELFIGNNQGVMYALPAASVLQSGWQAVLDGWKRLV